MRLACFGACRLFSRQNTIVTDRAQRSPRISLEDEGRRCLPLPALTRVLQHHLADHQAMPIGRDRRQSSPVGCCGLRKQWRHPIWSSTRSGVTRQQSLRLESHKTVRRQHRSIAAYAHCSAAMTGSREQTGARVIHHSLRSHRNGSQRQLCRWPIAAKALTFTRYKKETAVRTG
jgi:hypothetical protein